MVKDINGVEYSYANKDELAFGTFEEIVELSQIEEEHEELELSKQSVDYNERLVPRRYENKIPHDYVNKGLKKLTGSENKSW